MEEDRYSITIAMAIFMAVLASAAVVLRLEARRMRKNALKQDDWLILAALLLLYGMAICNILGAVGGMIGTHYSIDSKDPKNVQIQRTILRGQVIWALNIFCSLAPAFCRISILCFYKRIFVGKIFSVTCWTMIGLNACWAVGYFFANMLSCLPIEGNWAPDVPPTTCVDLVALYMSMPVTGVILDGLTLTIPWYPIWKLQMPLRQKVGVSGIFLLGSIAVIASIFRTIAMFQSLVPTKDRSWAHAPAFYWATIESGIGIAAACLPTMRPLLNKPGPASIVRSVQRMATNPFARSKMSSRSSDTSHRPSADSNMYATHMSQKENDMSPQIYTGDMAGRVHHTTRAESDNYNDIPLPLHGIAVQSSVSQSRGEHMV